MTVNVLLNLNIAPEDANGRVVYAVLADDEADVLMRGAAGALMLFLQHQLTAIEEHKAQLDRAGVTDPAIIGPLDQMRAVTAEMLAPATDLHGFATAHVRCGVLDGGQVQ